MPDVSFSRYYKSYGVINARIYRRSAVAFPFFRVNANYIRQIIQTATLSRIRKIYQNSKQAISELPFASFSKRVLARHHSHNNEFDLHENGRAGETRFNMNGFARRLVLTRRHYKTHGKYLPQKKKIIIIRSSEIPYELHLICS